MRSDFFFVTKSDERERECILLKCAHVTLYSKEADVVVVVVVVFFFFFFFEKEVYNDYINILQ